MSLRFERKTIFCRDLDRSLALYRDLLGLVPVEEKVIEGPAVGSLLQLPTCRMRIALLAPDAAADAMLGLFEISGAELPTLTPPVGLPAYGQTSLVLSTDRFDAIYASLVQEGVTFLTPPVKYPKEQASERSAAGLYREMIFYDPDWVLVSVMQIDPLQEPS